MKKIISLIFLFIALNISAQNATSILDKAIEAYNNSNGLNASFTMRINYGVQGGADSFEGVVDMKGDKFTFKTPDIHLWYDGITQWTFPIQSGEVNVNNPSENELLASNPAIILRNYKSQFDAKYKGESTATNGKAAYDIILTPKSRGDITEIQLQIDKQSYLQSSIVVATRDGGSYTIRFNEIKTNANQLDALFVFNESEYPDAEVIDLR
jgi:Outer membrane lipoprotein-sorting protein